jgi:protein-S-isoprenylcysteine O-methyltransferase Ste14
MFSLRIKDFALASILGIALCLVSYFSQFEMQEFQLWQRYDWTITSGPLPITFFWLIHAMLGLSLFLPGFYQVIEVVRVNQSAQAGKNRPIKLLTEGVYANRRHPMTGLFMAIVAGLFVSLRSTIGLILVVLFIAFFHAATLYEERTWLLPRFGKQYETYMADVPGRYFKRVQLIYLGVVLAISCLGIFL